MMLAAPTHRAQSVRGRSRKGRDAEGGSVRSTRAGRAPARDAPLLPGKSTCSRSMAKRRTKRSRKFLVKPAGLSSWMTRRSARCVSVVTSPRTPRRLLGFCPQVSISTQAARATGGSSCLAAPAQSASAGVDDSPHLLHGQASNGAYQHHESDDPVPRAGPHKQE
jgi:hypothetical protein